MNIHNTFVVADTHFAHDNMRRMRDNAKIGSIEFGSLEKMHEMLIDNWNSTVGENDHVVILGDFCWKPNCFDEIVQILHGKKRLVTGNHDFREIRKSPIWEDVQDIMRLRIGDESNSPKKERVEIYCSHYPMRCWNKSFHGSFHLYGHTHAFDMRDRREFNAGVDLPIKPFTPHRVADVLAAMYPRWYPQKGGEPMPDNDPRINEAFLQNYGRPFSARQCALEQILLASSGKIS